MNNIGWGIIGVPNGFQHISQGITANTANTAISAVDNRLCIEDYEKEPLYAVIYDTTIVGTTNTRQLMTYFVQYNFAREVEKDRSGSFYGSYIVLAGVVPEDIDCYKVIVSLLKNLSDYNRGFFINDNNRFRKDYFDDRENYDLNSDNFKEAVDLISKHTIRIKSITQKYENRKDVIVFSDDVTNVFLNSMELYGTYSTIYVTDSKAYCEYIKSKDSINCKEVLDLEKETLDIKEARQREIDRIKREQQEQKEKEIREQERIQKEEQERIRLHEEEVQNTFHRMEVLFLFFEENLSLVDLIEGYKSGTYDLEHLKDTYEAFESNANEAKRVSNIFEERKLELLAELKKIKSFDQQPKDELKLANEAAEAYPDPKPTINPMKTSDGYKGIKPEGSRGSTSSYNGQNNHNQLNTNGFSVKSIIIGILLLISIVLAIIAAIYFSFYKSDSEPSKPKLEFSTSQNNSIDGRDNSIRQDSNENNDIGIQYIPTDSESNIRNSFPTLSECNDSEDLQSYIVSIEDVRNIENEVRWDSDTIISRIMGSILNIDGSENFISDKGKDEFKEMLIECNESLTINKGNFDDQNSNLLLIKPNDSVRYVSVNSFK